VIFTVQSKWYKLIQKLFTEKIVPSEYIDLQEKALSDQHVYKMYKQTIILERLLLNEDPGRLSENEINRICSVLIDSPKKKIFLKQYLTFPNLIPAIVVSAATIMAILWNPVNNTNDIYADRGFSNIIPVSMIEVVLGENDHMSSKTREVTISDNECEIQNNAILFFTPLGEWEGMIDIYIRTHENKEILVGSETINKGTSKLKNAIDFKDFKDFPEAIVFQIHDINGQIQKHVVHLKRITS
jgi:hypothetical protein